MHETTTSADKIHPPSVGDLNSPTTTRPRIARRHYVIDRRRQYRAAALTSGLAFILLVIVNTAFTVLRNSQSMVLSAAAPKLRPVLEAQDTRIGALLLVASVVFVAGVFVITIAETHRTAGAVYALQKAFDRVRMGDYQTLLRLRPRDTLLDLRFPFNDMLISLRDRALKDAGELEQLAEEASSGALEAPELVARLTELAERNRDFGPR